VICPPIKYNRFELQGGEKKSLPFKVLDKFRGPVIAVPPHDMKVYDEVEIQIHK